MKLKICQMDSIMCRLLEEWPITTTEIAGVSYHWTKNRIIDFIIPT